MLLIRLLHKLVLDVGLQQLAGVQTAPGADSMAMLSAEALEAVHSQRCPYSLLVGHMSGQDLAMIRRWSWE